MGFPLPSPPLLARPLLPRPDPAPAPGKYPRRPAEPRRPLSRTALPSRASLLSRTSLHCPTSSAATSATPVTAATTAPTAAMASPTVLTFDVEGRAVDFDVWVDDLQFFLLCDSRDGVSLFDHTSGVSTAPAATADSTVRSQWTTRDAVARLAVRSHLPPAERTHFGQYKTAQSLYDAVVARYSSPATAALSRLMLPYLFPYLAAFATVADLVAHLRTSDARYRGALPIEFSANNHPPMYITLYYLVTRLPDSLSSVRDHFLSLCPTELTVDLLEERLAAAEKSILALGASRGDRRTPFFEGCSPVPLLPSVASAAAVDLVGIEEVGAASAPSGRRRNSKGKGSKGGLPLPVFSVLRDLPVLRLHSDRGGEFSSDLLRAFCRAEGIRQTFTLPASPQQNGIAELRIGMVMDVARTSMIHAAAPHFLYAAHQINL
ncbi:unnamed protein product [Closterium sp. NIES-54]